VATLSINAPTAYAVNALGVLDPTGIGARAVGIVSARVTLERVLGSDRNTHVLNDRAPSSASTRGSKLRAEGALYERVAAAPGRLGRYDPWRIGHASKNVPENGERENVKSRGLPLASGPSRFDRFFNRHLGQPSSTDHHGVVGREPAQGARGGAWAGAGD
jgi:hypothetical protein